MDQFMKNPDMPVILRGDYFRAVQAAFGDFSKVLVERAAEGSPIPKIENYDIHIEQTARTFVVWFRPTMRDPDHIVMGGGVTYTIDRNTFLIATRAFSK